VALCHVPGDVSPQQHRCETSCTDLVLLIIAKGIPTLLISVVSYVSALHLRHVSKSQNLLCDTNQGRWNWRVCSMRRVGKREARVGLVTDVKRVCRIREKSYFWRHRRRWKDNIKIDLQKYILSTEIS
jgi:hypothetical protein